MSKERPIIFSAEMVRAILDGRKTQTRRVVKDQERFANYREEWTEHTSFDGKPIRTFQITFAGYHGGGGEESTRAGLAEHYCPYGSPGDRLWVRETWMQFKDGEAVFRADCQSEEIEGRLHWWTRDGRDQPWPWKSPLHLPRNLSRITLEITAVRVERVRDISHDDALSEGVTDEGGCPIANFAELWESIHAGKPGESWDDDNPWVWCLSFKRCL